LTKSKKILIISQYFWPENFKINDLASHFSEKNYKIDVLTGIPNYPAGKFFQGYGIFQKRNEIKEGISIYRVPIIPRMKASSLHLGLNYISFVISSSIKVLFIKKKYDLIFIYEPSPITVAIPGIILKKIKRIPIIIWVTDLWPESVISASNLKSTLIPNLLTPLVKFIYKHCDKILVTSRGFINSIVEKKIDIKRIEYFPHWAETIFRPTKYEHYLLGSVPKLSFKIMFAGNIGEAQDFPSIIESARILKDNLNIQWVILGGGRKEEWVKSKIKEYKLEKTFHLLGSFPLDMMPAYYSQADCMLFSLKKEYIFSITIPAKVQTYLACAKPIVAMIDGEAAKLINDAKAGLSCPSESPELLAENINNLSLMKKYDLDKLGGNALAYYNKEFERTMLTNRMENIFNDMIKNN
jgi:glycosyltransferase involved in cell wall biosynthesis